MAKENHADNEEEEESFPRKVGSFQGRTFAWFRV